MKLHENRILFRQAVQFTADQMKLPAIYVEKDYWITFALFNIFNHEIAKDVVFKGGTSLSKCHKIIDRFSEDIDLIILRREGETDNKLRKKLKVVSSIIEPSLPEVFIDGITHKKGMNRKTAHLYRKEFTGDYGQVRDIILLESTWMGHHKPFVSKSIISFVGNMMIDNGQSEMAFANGFEEMLNTVGKDDQLSFKNNNRWLDTHPKEALLFRNPENIWNELKATYEGDFRKLVYSEEFPKEETIFNTLEMIQKRLKMVSWMI